MIEDQTYFDKSNYVNQNKSWEHFEKFTKNQLRKNNK